jgi:hypothetical protein
VNGSPLNLTETDRAPDKTRSRTQDRDKTGTGQGRRQGTRQSTRQDTKQDARQDKTGTGQGRRQGTRQSTRQDTKQDTRGGQDREGGRAPDQLTAPVKTHDKIEFNRRDDSSLIWGEGAAISCENNQTVHSSYSTLCLQ